MNTEILTAKQFIDAVLKEHGIEIPLGDVKIGRLFIDERENGYVCFYAFYEGMIYWLKAFKGKTKRVVKFAVAGIDVSVLTEYRPHNAFKSAYGNTTWMVNENDGEKGIYLTIGK